MLKALLKNHAKYLSNVRQRSLGPANFLYSDGETLFVHAHRRCWEENGGFSQPRPPGLSIISLDRAELLTRGLHVKGYDENIAIAAVASVPLTAESLDNPRERGKLFYGSCRTPSELARTRAAFVRRHANALGQE